MYCTNCGKQIDDKAVICVYCGVATNKPVVINPIIDGVIVDRPNEEQQAAQDEPRTVPGKNIRATW